MTTCAGIVVKHNPKVGEIWRAGPDDNWWCIYRITRLLDTKDKNGDDTFGDRIGGSSAPLGTRWDIGITVRENDDKGYWKRLDSIKDWPIFPQDMGMDYALYDPRLLCHCGKKAQINDYLCCECRGL